jgi:hypothetical protein
MVGHHSRVDGTDLSQLVRRQTCESSTNVCGHPVMDRHGILDGFRPNRRPDTPLNYCYQRQQHTARKMSLNITFQIPCGRRDTDNYPVPSN